MNRCAKWLLIMTCAALAPCIISGRYVSAKEQRAPSSSDEDFAKYRIIVDRNIFDPARRSDEPVQRHIVEKTEFAPPPVEHLYLTGVLLADDGERLAFFEGSKPEYMAVIDQGKQIAGFTVADVESDHVTLARDGSTTDLFVGTGLSRTEGEPWKPATGLEYAVETTAPTADVAKPDATNERLASKYNKPSYGYKSPGKYKKKGNTSALDILKKLKERRKQEYEQ